MHLIIPSNSQPMDIDCRRERHGKTPIGLQQNILVPSTWYSIYGSTTTTIALIWCPDGIRFMQAQLS